MQPEALLPSAVSKRCNPSVLFGSGFVAYAATLAIYLHDLSKDHRLFRILSGPDRPLITFATDTETVAALCDNFDTFLWDLNGVIICKTTLNLFRHSLGNSACKQSYFLAGDESSCSIWQYRKGQIVNLPSSKSGNVSCIDWSSASPNVACAGTVSGDLLVFDFVAYNQTATLHPFHFVDGGLFSSTVGVVGCAFDPCNANYIFVHSTEGHAVLYDRSAICVLSCFETESSPLRRVRWLPKPGLLISVDGTSNQMRLWNVSLRRPIKEIRIPGEPLVQLAASFENGLVVCAVNDGSVCVFDLESNKTVFKPVVGHAETIFEVKFSPDQQIAASCSHDGRVRVWNVDRFTLLHNIYVGGTLYSLDWISQDIIAVGCSDGELRSFTLSGTQLWHKPLHQELVWRVACHRPTKLVASTSRDGKCCLVNGTDGSLLRTFFQTKPVFGVAFDLLNPARVAVGCHDGVIRLHDPKGTFNELKGHSAEVHHVQWNPHHSNILASGSNDKTVRIWDTESLLQLAIGKGHTDKVRALHWCTIDPTILLSGSWDGTIRVWRCAPDRDSKQYSCVPLFVNYDHLADVYSLDSHPNRPGLFISGSRDTTIRLWRLSSIDRLTLPAAFGQLKQNVAETVSRNLTASRASDLSELLQKADPAMALRSFYPLTGLNSLLACIKDFAPPLTELAQSQPLEVIPLSDIIDNSESELRTLSKLLKNEAMSGGSLHKERLCHAAELELRLGRAERASDLLFQAGEYDRSVAVAAKAGLSFWRETCLRVADTLASQSNSLCVQYFILGEDPKRAASFLTSVKEFDSALLILQMCNTRATHSPVSMEDSTLGNAKDTGELINSVVEIRAQSYGEQGLSLLAAASHASLRREEETILSLLKFGLIPIALCVARDMNLSEGTKETLFAQGFFYCLSFEDWEGASALLERTNSPYFTAWARVACKGSQARFTPNHVRLRDDPLGSVVDAIFKDDFDGATTLIEGLLQAALREPNSSVLLLARKATNLLRFDLLPPERAVSLLKECFKVGLRLASIMPSPRWLRTWLSKLAGEPVDDALPDEPCRFLPTGCLFPRKWLGKVAVSVVSGKEISGAMVLLEDGVSVMAGSEALAWCEVCAFSPLGSSLTLNPFLLQ